jgi:hypothetical protein
MTKSERCVMLDGFPRVITVDKDQVEVIPRKMVMFVVIRTSWSHYKTKPFIIESVLSWNLGDLVTLNNLLEVVPRSHINTSIPSKSGDIGEEGFRCATVIAPDLQDVFGLDLVCQGTEDLQLSWVQEELW